MVERACGDFETWLLQASEPGPVMDIAGVSWCRQRASR
jgi:hypothetical protein